MSGLLAFKANTPKCDREEELFYGGRYLKQT